MATLKDKVLGCMMGGAVGDALGYPVEFVESYEKIKAIYGEGGITRYDMSYPGLEGHCSHALFSDDTQMTLYTAEGLLYAEKHRKPILPTISNAYLAWLGPQVGKKISIAYHSELAEIDSLNQRRAPGNTCISALMSIHSGKEPVNNSKGCGGIMRIAPIGAYAAAHGWAKETTAKLAGDVAEITHLHKMSTLSSAFTAVIIQHCLLYGGSMNTAAFEEIADDALACTRRVYPNDVYIDEFDALIHKALRFKDSGSYDWQIIENELGGGWVAEETLAIAIFSVIRHIDNFKDCLVSAVNHGGDSDSTGAVAGNIIGAILGYGAIPEEFAKWLQLRDLIKEFSEKLYDRNSQ